MFPEIEPFESGMLDVGDAQSLVDVYAALAFSSDVAVREEAAREWCAWEDTHISLTPGFSPNRRFKDEDFRLLFTRLVTHYWRHAAFLEENQLIRNAALLDGLPGVLLHGRYDISSPLETAWNLRRQWRGSVLRVIDEAGHGGDAMREAIVDAMNQMGAPLRRSP